MLSLAFVRRYKQSLLCVINNFCDTFLHFFLLRFSFWIQQICQYCLNEVLLSLFSFLIPPSARWAAVWAESPGRWTVPTTTCPSTRPSATRTRSHPSSRSVTPAPVPPPSITTSTTSPMDTRRTQAATPAIAGGTYRQLTTSGGRDPGEQYVDHIIFVSCCLPFFVL